jgi:replicative DNA helicase
MTLKEAYEKRRQEVLSLQRQLKKLEKELANKQ